MKLFIDTNIFLSFYHLSSDDLEELRKLSVLLRQRQVELLLPSQVVDEFRRNRENKIADSLKGLREQKLNLQYPQICKDYEEYSKLSELQKEYEKHHTILLEKINKNVNCEGLKADAIIKELFDLATLIDITDDLVKRAQLRYNRGNPPGKKNSLGDAIIWESILTVPEKNDVHFITDDGDYCSPLNKDMFNGFLLYEWSNAKGSHLFFYKRLSNFFKAYFPDIRLASELEKDLLIRSLAQSRTFAQTHSIIAQLNKYIDYTADQINDIIVAAISNGQIYRIINDDDLRDFFTNIIIDYENVINPENYDQLVELLESDGYEEEED